MHATPHSRFRAPWLIVALAAIGVIALAAGVVHFAPSSCAMSAAGVDTGTAVFYNPVQAGDRCSIEPLAGDGLYASLPPRQYGNGTDCGAYLTITGPRGTVRAEIVDICPGCSAGQLDLSTAAFSRIQPLADGTAPVSYQLTQNPALPAPLAVRIQTGSTRGSMAIQVLNHGNPLTRVQVNGQNLTPRADGYWVARGGAGGGPFQVNVTDSAGNSAVLTGITFRPGAVQQTAVLMYGSPPQTSTPAPAPAPPPATLTLHGQSARPSTSPIC
ncbi:MAG TPA: expansin EXLX1 family cellulose-binding protein [Streptosporangiaceae bacterium]|jgi:expansin (peptidoglycan-binding protein)